MHGLHGHLDGGAGHVGPKPSYEQVQKGSSYRSMRGELSHKSSPQVLTWANFVL